MNGAAALHHDFAAALAAPTMKVPSALIVGSAREAERRFAVHRNTFVVSLIDALSESFPVTRALVGAQFFRAMARERILADPPRSPVLTDFAVSFPDYISSFTPAAAVPYLADVARIEAMRIAAYHAADAAPLTETRFQELLATPQRLSGARLRLHPACHWIRSRYAVHSLWSAHQGLTDMAEASLASIDIESPEDVLIARPDLELVTLPIPPGASTFLDALQGSQSLGIACQQASDAVAHADVRALFALLIQNRLVIDIDIPHGELA